jgi:hypothetical protein
LALKCAIFWLLKRVKKGTYLGEKSDRENILVRKNISFSFARKDLLINFKGY